MELQQIVAQLTQENYVEDYLQVVARKDARVVFLGSFVLMVSKFRQTAPS